MLLDGGFPYVWTQEEYNQFVDDNRQYVCETNALRLIKLYYRRPNEGEKCQFMSAMDIVNELKERRKLSSAAQQVNEVSVGQALTVLGFRQHSGRNKDGQPRYGYDIYLCTTKVEHFFSK